jgi:hypothetical protein
VDIHAITAAPPTARVPTSLPVESWPWKSLKPISLILRNTLGLAWAFAARFFTVMPSTCMRSWTVLLAGSSRSSWAITAAEKPVSIDIPIVAEQMRRFNVMSFPRKLVTKSGVMLGRCVTLLFALCELLIAHLEQSYTRLAHVVG